MANSSREAVSQHPGDPNPGNRYGDRDPVPDTPPPAPSPGVDVVPPSRGGGDDDEQ